MTVIASTDSNFVFGGLPRTDIAASAAHLAAAPATNPLGLLVAQLPGTWTGHGFNTICGRIA